MLPPDSLHSVLIWRSLVAHCRSRHTSDIAHFITRPRRRCMDASCGSHSAKQALNDAW